MKQITFALFCQSGQGERTKLYLSKIKKEIQSVKAHLCSVFSGFVKIGDWYLKMSEVKEYKPVTAEDMNPYILFKTSKFGNIKVRFPKDEDMDAELLVLDQLFDVE